MTSQNKSNSALAKVITFNDILCPLMLAIAKTRGILNDKESCDVEALLLAKLIENVVGLTKKYIADKGLEDNQKTRWNVARNISQIVAPNYNKTKDVVELNAELPDFDLDFKEDIKKISSDEDFKNNVFESMSNVVNAVSRFNFAMDEKVIISGAETQISTYVNNLFSAVDKDSLSKGYFNHLYIKTIRNLSELFDICYYNVIDATLAVPKEEREAFITRHMIERSDSIEKALDGFYSRVSIISNITVSLEAPLDSVPAKA